MGSVRQTATILSMSKEHLRTGDKAVVRFRFIKTPEYLKPDMRMVFREGRTKAVGTVTKLYPHISATAQNTRQQRAAKKAVEANHHHGQQSHQMKPQNEPKKPSKKNRRSRHRAPYPGDDATHAPGDSSGTSTAAVPMSSDAGLTAAAAIS